MNRPNHTGPHARIPVANERERFLAQLLDALWDRYRQRVKYVQQYETLVADLGGTFVNDHVAFRTFASQQPSSGIASLSRMFEVLGYVAANCYQFPDKSLSAIHFQHPNGLFPKLFISELRTWELPAPARESIGRILRSRRAPLADEYLARLFHLQSSDFAELLPLAIAEVEQLPWEVPERQDLERLNSVSQYAAWVAVHGNNVNHYTALINSQGVARLGDIDRTVSELQRVGVPMKVEIEGALGSKLRQTATEAVVIPVPVREQGRLAEMPWSYAYFELAERGEITDPESGRRGRFEGFLGPQATNLFEMTRR